MISVAKSMTDGCWQIIGFLFPEDFVGVASGGAYSCTAQAVTKAELCRFPHSSIEALAEEFPELKHRLLCTVSSELLEVQEHMLILGRQSAEERVASFLLHLSKRASRRGEPDNPVRLQMSRGEIGDYLDPSLETVSRTFAVLRDRGGVALIDAHTIELLAKDQPQLVIEGA